MKKPITISRVPNRPRITVMATGQTFDHQGLIIDRQKSLIESSAISSRKCLLGSNSSLPSVNLSFKIISIRWRAYLVYVTDIVNL